MRIVGGTFKGRSLFEFNGLEVRPTADKTRESLFNIIKERTMGAEFLDLFCGTGAVGIEALSRGAKSVSFNDISKNSITLAQKNLTKVDKEGVAKIGVNVFFTTLSAKTFITNSTKKYDVVFIDAPYSSLSGEEALFGAESLLKDGGIVVFESENKLQDEYNGLKKYDERKYGRAYLTFFSKE